MAVDIDQAVVDGHLQIAHFQLVGATSTHWKDPWKSLTGHRRRERSTHSSLARSEALICRFDHLPALPRRRHPLASSRSRRRGREVEVKARRLPPDDSCMMLPGKCPSCGKPVASLRLYGVDATESGYSSIAPGLRAITLCCPNLNCGKVLGAQVDPIALRTDIVEMTADQVVKKLRGLPPT